MENHQKTLQNEEKLLKRRQNGFKTHQIAPKGRKNDVSRSKIRFETDLKPKNHKKSPKSRENCPLGLGHYDCSSFLMSPFSWWIRLESSIAQKLTCRMVTNTSPENHGQNHRWFTLTHFRWRICTVQAVQLLQAAVFRFFLCRSWHPDGWLVPSVPADGLTL